MTYGPYNAIVTEVHDGDTIKVDIDLGFGIVFYIAVRVFGINAPELSTEAGKVSRDFARLLLPVGTPIRLFSHSWDKYGGRIDGEIHYTNTDGVQQDFAETMINSGHAVAYRA